MGKSLSRIREHSEARRRRVNEALREEMEARLRCVVCMERPKARAPDLTNTQRRRQCPTLVPLPNLCELLMVLLSLSLSLSGHDLQLRPPHVRRVRGARRPLPAVPRADHAAHPLVRLIRGAPTRR